jgi:hypothetical protein
MKSSRNLLFFLLFLILTLFSSCEQSTTVPSFIITYVGNGNSSGSVPVDNKAYSSGTSVTILGAGTLVKNESSFSGWNTESGGTGTAYAAGSILTITADITLYAQWTAAKSVTYYNISYHGNGNTSGSAPKDSTKYVSGATVTVLGSGSLARGSYSFSGWNTKSDGTGTQYNAGATITITEDFTLYALWSGGSTITITDSPSGITLSLTNADGTALSDVVFIALPTTVLATTSTSPDSYAWYLDSVAISGAASSSVAIGSDLTAGSYHALTCVIKKDLVLLSASYSFQAK